MQFAKKEIRIHHQRLFELDSAELAEYDAVCLGHTSCIHKMNGLTTEHIDRVLEMNKQVKIEIPIVFQSHFSTIIEQLKEWIQKPIGLVINDYGLLHELKKLGISQEVTITLGRNLVYSFFNCPGYEDIINHEEEPIQLEWLNLNLDNEPMQQFLQDYQVQELDVDLTPNLEGSINRLRNSGFKVNGFTQYPLSSISRSCHSVRSNQSIIGECQHLCEQAIHLEPRQRWNRFDDTLIGIPKPTREQLGNLLVFGNTVVRDIPDIQNIDYPFDTLCIDQRFSPF